MIARWDALLVAAILSAGATLIGNSHQVDAGASDDALASSQASLCPDDSAPAPASVAAATDADGDARFSLSAADDRALAGSD